MVKKIILNLISILSVLLIVFSLFVLLSVIMTKPGETPNVFGYSLMRVMTGSMEPEIPVNSMILVKQVPITELKEQDIISFYSRDPSLNGAVNTHRIMRIEEYNGEKVFYTKGDANNIEDHYETFQKDVIGKVVFTSYRLGQFIRLISNPLIFVPLIIIPLLIIILRNLYTGIKSAKELIREEEEAAVREAIREIKERKKETEDEDGRNS